jgi:hypothetical protein
MQAHENHQQSEFEIDGNAVRIRKAAQTRSRRSHRLIAQMRGRANTKLTTDEIMALTRPATRKHRSR